MGDRAATRGTRLVEHAAQGLIVLFLALDAVRVFVTNVNWDEFYYLSFVHLFRGGQLSLPLQTFHVRLFAWLPWVSGDEMQQIFAGRSVMWLAGLASAWLIYRIASRISGRTGALFAVILYLSFSYVMDHGTSFRADPLCAFLFLVAADALTGRSETPTAVPVAAVAMAVAMLVSMKSMFYLLTIAVLLAALAFDRPRPGAVLHRMAVFAAIFPVALAGLYLWHGHGLTAAAGAGEFAASAGRKTIGTGSLAVAWPFVERALTENPLTWLLVASGVWLAGRQLPMACERRDAVMILSFVLPLLSLAVYRNAFPYYFVFLMPAAVIPSAVAIEYLAHRTAGGGGGGALAALMTILALAAAGYSVDFAKTVPDRTVAQAQVVRAVHAMFPEPVPYIDRNSMIASFPKVGFFMSTWGLESYRAAHRPVMADLLARYAPPLLIANTPALDPGHTGAVAATPYALYPEDREVLRENYIHHWGVIYVAGKHLLLAAADGTRTFECLIPGLYTLEAAAAVALDGAPVAPSAVVSLARGTHRLAVTGDLTMPVTLRWGRGLYVPAEPPSPQPIYTGF